MTKKQGAALLYAAENISKKKEFVICAELYNFGIEILDIPEARMICPYKETWQTKQFAWWGSHTMDVFLDSAEAQGARLIGIAMMLTMPKEMLED